MRKLIFFDIDGTLCMPGEQPTQVTVEAIRRARERGHYTFLSTGRSICGIPDAVRAIGFDGLITSAGAHAEVGDEVILDQPMAPELCRQVLRALEVEDAAYVLECAEGNYSDLDRVRNWPDYTPELESFFETVKKTLRIQDVSEYHAEPCYKVCFFAPDRTRLQGLHAALDDRFTFTLFDNLFPGLDAVCGELNRREVDKGLALAAICRKLGLTPEDAVAFGDSTNDLAMLRAAGLGFAMANGQEEVKRQADRICPACAEDGVARTLIELGLA